MNDLLNKKKMDNNAEKSIKSVLTKVDEIFNLFVSSQRSGTTTALEGAIERAEAPLFLTDKRDQAKKLLSPEIAKKTKVLSWSTASPEKMRRQSKYQLIVDNSFMIRAFDSIKSVIRFLYGEVTRLKEENKTLRDANNRLADKAGEAISEKREAKQINEKLRDRVTELKEKLNTSSNGKA